jgi:signal transduction histidine kinase
VAEAKALLPTPSDPRGRLVPVFLGAVLLPSIALSVLSFHAVPKHAEVLKLGLLKQADRMLGYLEKDLETAARKRALEAARRVGPEPLLEGTPETVRMALESAGFPGAVFESLRLEARSPLAAGLRPNARPATEDIRVIRDALRAFDPMPGADGEDAVPLTNPEGKELGVLRFRYAQDYVSRDLLRDFFEHDFANPDQAWVVRVTDPTGAVLYENAPTPDDRFEVRRVMSAASFRGLELHLRNKDRSIEREVRRLAVAKTALIAFVDVMLFAGLFLVYSNVRREMHLSRLKSDFVANVSHELKTPLALIRLFAETLELGRVPGESKARQYYQIINKESQRLTQLINNILDFSRIEAGRKQYRFVRTDVARVVREVLDAYRFPIEQQGFVLELSVGEDLPEVELDPEAIAQALLNLVNNAIKYSREEKYLGLSVRRDHDRLLIAVKDRGIGIAKADQKRVFEKFFRAENSLVHTTKGSGLGLALVQHIMEAHGGSVELESSPGQGSTFTLVLPIRQERGAERGAERA